MNYKKWLNRKKNDLEGIKSFLRSQTKFQLKKLNKEMLINWKEKVK